MNAKIKYLTTIFFGLILLTGVVSAVPTNTLVWGSVMMKGASGVLIPLGIELFVDGPATTYLYNLMSVSILLFIAAMSGPRSEAAFCIVIPIFAGIMESFGWMKLATVSATNGLIALTVVMGIFGVFMYMNDQNKQNYGTLGPGSKWFNIAFFLICFTAAMTLVSGFSIFPPGSTQPIPGTCAAGLTCDAYGNIDFTSSIGSISHSGGLLAGAVAIASGLLGIAIAAATLMLNILTGIVLFPVVLNSVLNGIFPGISSNTSYQAFMIAIGVALVLIYAKGFYDMFWKPPGAVSTI